MFFVWTSSPSLSYTAQASTSKTNNRKAAEIGDILVVSAYGVTGFGTLSMSVLQVAIDNRKDMSSFISPLAIGTGVGMGLAAALFITGHSLQIANRHYTPKKHPLVPLIVIGGIITGFSASFVLVGQILVATSRKTSKTYQDGIDVSNTSLPPLIAGIVMLGGAAMLHANIKPTPQWKTNAQPRHTNTPTQTPSLGEQSILFSSH